MRLQGEADFCQGLFVNFGRQLSVSWLSARRPLPPMPAVVVPKKLHHDVALSPRAPKACRAGIQPEVVTRGP